MGSSVNTPKLNVIDVTRVETYADGRKTPDRGYNIILTVEGAEEVLFLSNPNHRARKIGDAHYEVAGSHHSFYIPAMAIRAARPTGEVCVLDVEELVKSATKVGPSWVARERALEKARRHKEKYGLSDVERNEIIAKLRNRVGSLYEQQNMVMRLKDEGAQESVAVFLEILYSDRDPVIKQPALRGLVRVKGKEGLDHYRALAADGTQSDDIRSIAIERIGKFGDQQEISLLRRIARTEERDLPSIYASEEEIARLEQNRFDGVDVLLYELWSAVRRLEAKP